MKKLTRWGPPGIALLAILALHAWHLKIMVSGENPLFGVVPFQTALLASLRDIPSTAFMLLPAWLPALVPAKWPRVSRWSALFCGAASVAISASFAILVAVHREYEFLAVVTVYGMVGILHLFHRPAKSRAVAAHAT